MAFLVSTRGGRAGRIRGHETTKVDRKIAGAGSLWAFEAAYWSRLNWLSRTQASMTSSLRRKRFMDFSSAQEGRKHIAQDASPGLCSSVLDYYRKRPTITAKCMRSHAFSHWFE